MGIHLAEQTTVFLQACLLGAALSVLYDLFRILRVAFPPRPGMAFVQDLLFWTISALVTFFFVLVTLDGTVRGYLLIGELLGWLLYHFTLGAVVMRLAQTLIVAVRAVLRAMCRFILRPAVKLACALAALLLWPWRCVAERLKKIQQSVKFRLKVRRIILYNYHIGRTGRKPDRKHGEKAAYEQTGKDNETA